MSTTRDASMLSDPHHDAASERSLPAPLPAAEKHTYGEILRSSALIGGSSVMTIAIGIVRTKAMAVMLGPAGVGLLGILASIGDLARAVAGMGISNSGVRQIAEAVSSGDEERIARTVTVLRRIAILLGVLGAVLVVAFSRQIAILTFGNDGYTPAVALLSAVVLFHTVADSRAALLQGMRRIADLAKMGVLGALLGTIVSVTLVYFLREDGVAPALVGVAVMTMLAAWWYGRKVQVVPPRMPGNELRREATALLTLGIAFMASAFLMMGAAYVVRMAVLRDVGLEAAGLYQAAWTLGGLYVGVVLQAMAADFYPRLVGVANDNPECNRIVNEQARVSLLLAGPGVIATIALAPLVLTIFYTAKFVEAVDVLRWICLGMALRVVTWPMGFIIVAKGRQGVFFGTELAWTLVNVGLSLLFVRYLGLEGAGIAFLGSYVFHAFLIYPIVRKLSGFRWSMQNLRTGAAYLSLIAIAFYSFQALPPGWALVVGMLAATASAVHSARLLVKLVAVERVPRPLRRLLTVLRLA